MELIKKGKVNGLAEQLEKAPARRRELARASTFSMRQKGCHRRQKPHLSLTTGKSRYSLYSSRGLFGTKEARNIDGDQALRFCQIAPFLPRVLTTWTLSEFRGINAYQRRLSLAKTEPVFFTLNSAGDRPR